MHQSSTFHTQENNDKKTNIKCLNGTSVPANSFKCNGVKDNTISLPCPPLISMITRGDLDKSDLCELRNRMISQKWLLSRWVTLKERELESKCKNIARELKLLKQNDTQTGVTCNGQFDNLTNLINSKSNRVQFTGGIKPDDDRKSIRNGPCCFSTEDSNDSTVECHKPALPFTRHCAKHILYNVDQLLFERCVAKSTTSPLTQCSNATFCIEKDRKPLCIEHQRLLVNGVLIEDEKEVTTTSGKGRKRPKSNLVTRSTRRKNTKGKGKGKGDETQETISAGSIGNRVDSNVNFNIIDVDLITNDHHTVPPVPPTLHPIDTVNHDSSSNTYPLGVDANGDIPTGLDVDIHNLTAGDEALVASLVEDLPPLGASTDEVVVGDANSSHAFDAEFNEVLNKLPPEAFNEIFSTENHHTLAHATPQVTVTTPSVTLTGQSGVSHHNHQLHHQRSIQPSHHITSHHSVNKVPSGDAIETIVMDVDSNLFSPRVNAHHHTQQQQHSHHSHHHHPTRVQQPPPPPPHHVNLSHHHQSPPVQSVLKDCTSIVNGNDCTYTGYLGGSVVQSTVGPSSAPCANGITVPSASNGTIGGHSHVSQVDSSVTSVTGGGTVTAVNSHCITNTPVNHTILPSNLANLLMYRQMSINNSPSTTGVTSTHGTSVTSGNAVAVATVSSTTGQVSTLPQVNDDLCGLATNILGCLTKEQQQQLNGLIDGALASGSLSSSPTLKHAPVSLDTNSFPMTTSDTSTAHLPHMTTGENCSVSNAISILQQTNVPPPTASVPSVTGGGAGGQLLTAPSTSHLLTHIATPPVITNGTLMYKTGNILGNSNQ